MMIEMQFNSIAQLQRLQEIASSCDDEIFLHSLDDSVRVDAKSFIGLFTLDFTQPVKVVTDSDYLARKVEHEQVVCRLGKIETLCQHHETLQLI